DDPGEIGDDDGRLHLAHERRVEACPPGNLRPRRFHRAVLLPGPAERPFETVSGPFDTLRCPRARSRAILTGRRLRGAQTRAGAIAAVESSTEQMPDPEFRIAVRPAEGGTRIELAGELDVSTAAQFQRAADEIMTAAGDVWLDCSNLTFADSSGLDALTR